MDAVAVKRRARQATMRVFVVEDSGAVLDSLADLMAVMGQARIVGVARSEAEALDWAESHPTAWDLAIVDLILEPGSGFSVIRRLKHSNPAGHVVVFSGYISPVIREHCEGLGANLVLGKDQSEQLASYVEQLMCRP